VDDPRLPDFDLVVATVDRVAELERLLESLERQSHQGFRVLVVDQNDDDRLGPMLERPRAFEVTRLRSAQRGLSRARNAALGLLRAELVAFPDDDCVFPDDLFDRVGRRFLNQPELDALTGRAVDEDGGSSSSWARDPAVLTRDNLWNRAISFTIFMRALLVDRVGAFDEALGLGAGGAWSSGEEIDYLVRALDTGARVEYDPSLVVLHRQKELSASGLQSVGARDGASIGYILRKHRYRLPTVARMFARPLGGAVISLLRRDPSRTRFHLSTLRGRLLGYRS
jgi:glycosyltransferase involved in cell wall biosynthesis